MIFNKALEQMTTELIILGIHEIISNVVYHL
jgi:hypothetical protein